MKLVFLFLLILSFSCTRQHPKTVKEKYCLSNVSHSFLDSFVRRGDYFLNEALLDKLSSHSSDFRSVANHNEDVALLRDKDAIPKLYKKYNSLDESGNFRTGEELDIHTFVVFSEMKQVQFEAFLKEAKKSQKFCFHSDVARKKDSYPGVELFFAKEYESF